VGYFFFFVYLFFCGWLLSKIRFVRQSGLGNIMLWLLFGVKVAAGIAAGLLYQNQPESDTWKNHAQALEEYHLLFSHPKIYLTNLFYSGYGHGYSGFWAASDSYWNDLKTNLLLKFISVLDIFSFGHYYVNVVLYNFIVLLGAVVLYRMFQKMYSNAKWALIIGCFLLPSTLFFTSMIHKDGLVFVALAIVCYGMQAFVQIKRMQLTHLLALGLSLLLIVFFRVYIAVVLLPALTAWYIAATKNLRPWLVFILTFTACGILFFASVTVPALNLPAAVVQKQAAFLALEQANSFIGVPKLTTAVVDFITAAPMAFSHTLLRPSFFDWSLSPMLLPFVLEWTVYWLLVPAFVLFRYRTRAIPVYLIFAFFFFITMMLIIGYTVPALWAIIRYKSILLPLVVTPLIAGTDWQKLAKRLSIKK
jgi:hypothetical protein